MRKSAFTLLELMIVIIIVGILATLAIPQFTKAAEKARLTEAFGMVGTIKKAIFMYRAEYNCSPLSGATIFGTDINTLGLHIEVPGDSYFHYFISTGGGLNVPASVDNLRIGGRNPAGISSGDPASLSVNINEEGVQFYKLRGSTKQYPWP